MFLDRQRANLLFVCVATSYGTPGLHTCGTFWGILKESFSWCLQIVALCAKKTKTKKTLVDTCTSKTQLSREHRKKKYSVCMQHQSTSDQSQKMIQTRATEAHVNSDSFSLSLQLFLPLSLLVLLLLTQSGVNC